MIRPNRAHTPVFPDRNYRVWKAVRAHNSLDHGMISVWLEVNSVWKVWSMSFLVWTMVWARSDQRSIRSRRSDHSLFLVWTTVWVRSDQRSVWSGRSDHSLYSLDHGLGSVWSEVNSVWKVWFRVHYFFQFFCFFIEGCWLRQEATIKQRSD